MAWNNPITVNMTTVDGLSYQLSFDSGNDDGAAWEYGTAGSGYYVLVAAIWSGSYYALTVLYKHDADTLFNGSIGEALGTHPGGPITDAYDYVVDGEGGYATVYFNIPTKPINPTPSDNEENVQIIGINKINKLEWEVSG